MTRDGILSLEVPTAAGRGDRLTDSVKKNEGWRKALRYLGRALLLRCPVCGVSPIFTPLNRTRRLRDWFTPLDGCPRCGYPYEREPGYFLASVWIINYGAGSMLGIIIYLSLELTLHPPIHQLLALVVTPIILFNILFARHAKAVFMALDHFYDPHERNPGDDGGDLLKPEAPPRGSGDPRNPIPSSGKKPDLVHH